MKSLIATSSAVLALADSVISGPVTPRSDTIFFKPISVTSDSVHNVHLSYGDGSFEGDVRVVYGDCDLTHPDKHHHEIGSSWIKRSSRPDRLVWIVPENITSGGCLHAFSATGLIGRSAPISVKHQPRKREDISKIADVTGPWFEALSYMQSKKNNDSFIAVEKSKKIGIVGGGMSGLMTGLLLDSVGIKDW